MQGRWVRRSEAGAQEGKPLFVMAVIVAALLVLAVMWVMGALIL